MDIIAADIGGTYSRLARMSTRPGSPPPLVRHFENARFARLVDVIDAFITASGGPPTALAAMVLALPAPIADTPFRLTNIDWEVNHDELLTRFAPARLQLVNDFQAAAVGALSQPHAQLIALNTGERVTRAPAVVTGAGTGLGLAWFAHGNRDELPWPTEGGHADFAPGDAQQRELHAWLASRFGHVSYERLLSGDGLVNIYQFLVGTAHVTDAPATVGALAAAGDAQASAAVRLFVRIFGAYAGNLALLFNPGNGIYISGGLAGHLATWFAGRDFLDAFLAKGRMSQVAGRIPVYLVKQADSGLTGAIQIATNTIRADS